MVDVTHLIQQFGGYPIRQQLRHGPDMIGHSSRHRRGDATPTPRRSTAPCWRRRIQALAQTVVWQHQMIVGQREPQLLFQPGSLFAKAAGLAGQAPIVLAQGEVLPFDKTGIDGVAGGRIVQPRLNRVRSTEHGFGRDGHYATVLPLLHYLRVEQRGRRLAPRLRMRPAPPLAARLIPLPVDMQQRGAVLGQLITREEGDAVIAHMGHPFQQQIGARLGAFAHHKGHHQSPDRCEGDPNPGIPIGFTHPFRRHEVLLFGMDKAPQLVQLAFAHGQVLPQIQHHPPTLLGRSVQPRAGRIFIDLDNPPGRPQRIALRQRADGGFKLRRLGIKFKIGGVHAQRHTPATCPAQRLLLAPRCTVLDQQALIEWATIIGTAPIRTVERVPVHSILPS